MRIIAGEYRGRLLKTLRGLELRPTSDKLRETLFNIIRAEVPGSVFIDCYAGSGAVGLEAASRGAAQVFLIEKSPAAVRVIEQNIASLSAALRARVLRAEVRAGLRKLEMQGIRATICFLDPPYAALPEATRTLAWLAASTLMLSDGRIILEHARRDVAVESVASWKRVRLLDQGTSSLSIYRLHGY